MAKCSRCLSVFYCSAECQTRDWKEHKPRCRRIDPAKCCDLCWEETAEVKNCGRCRVAKYCSAKCQKEDWPTHKKKCEKKEIE